jgi:shikimate dehydrogenase
MTISMGLMGYGIAKSRMAKLQNYLGQLHGIDIDYILIDGTTSDKFDCLSEVKQRMEQGFLGLNVTHPYKEMIRTLVDAPLIEQHALIGSYNTLKFIDGKIFGANTDYSGFIRGFRSKFPNSSPGKVLLCGAGGVGRAIAFALASLKAEQISIFDLDDKKTQNLCAALRANGAHAIPVSKQDLAENIKQADGLVNCTALGMHSYPGSAFPAELITQQKWAFDAVYTPLKTEFLLACEQQNLACINGFDLWIYQGLDAFKLFTSVSVSVETQVEVLATALGWLD